MTETQTNPRRSSPHGCSNRAVIKAVEEAEHPDVVEAVSEGPSRLPLLDGCRWGCGY